MSLRRTAAAAILAICIGAPIVEAFDQWDQTLQDGNDTEANVVVVALCVGLAIAVGTVAIAARPHAAARIARPHALRQVMIAFTAPLLASPIPTVSPPPPLRV